MSTSIRTALVSVSDKSNLATLSSFLIKNGITIYSTGGTLQHIKDNVDDNQKLVPVSDLTKFPEILSGRVKTLHPVVYGGLLARRHLESDMKTLEEHQIPPIDLVVSNLYPFSKTLSNPDATDEDIIENIDIGGPCMVRAAAKNYKDVVILTHPGQYEEFMDRYTNESVDSPYRLQLAQMAFDHVFNYDRHISDYFNRKADVITTINRQHYITEKLKYGLNPHQSLAMIGINEYNHPVFRRPLNGQLGYINVLDAINAWCLVHEASIIDAQLHPDLDEANRPVFAASFKHTSPAGVARSRNLTEDELKWYGVEGKELSESAKAYLLARYCDPKSSFGDFVSIAGVVDKSCAELMKREVGDGVIAWEYTEEAFEILKQKKGGKYIILQTNPDFDVSKPQLEVRELHGLVLCQESDSHPSHYGLEMDNCKSKNQDVSESHLADLVLANVTLKYTQSNSVAFAFRGQCVVAAGQQNRVDCTRLAGHKMRNLLIRFTPQMMMLFNSFKPGVKRQQKVNAIYSLLDGVTQNKTCYQEWLELFLDDQHKIIKGINWSALSHETVVGKDLCLASDAFFPFEDNIDVAQTFGVTHIVQPGGSIRDKEVLEKVDQYGMTMIMTGNRLFLH